MWFVRVSGAWVRQSQPDRAMGPMYDSPTWAMFDMRDDGRRLGDESPRAPSVISSSPLARRMLAVMAADVVDYTRLMETAELETHVRLRALRVGLIDPCIVSHRGQGIK